MRKGKIWTKFKVGSEDWVARLVPESADEDLPGNHGLTLIDSKQVLMNRETVPGKSPAILFHELGHVAIDANGGRDLLFRNLGIHESRWEEAEEAIVELFGNSLFNILSQNKWLKLPKAPKQ